MTFIVLLSLTVGHWVQKGAETFQDVLRNFVLVTYCWFCGLYFFKCRVIFFCLFRHAFAMWSNNLWWYKKNNNNFEDKNDWLIRLQFSFVLIFHWNPKHSMKAMKELFCQNAVCKGLYMYMYEGLYIYKNTRRARQKILTSLKELNC